MADHVDVSGEPSKPVSQPAAGEEQQQKFGLTAAMALIIGSIIGVGIFNLPTSLAFYGPITLVSMALTTVGALVLALLFAALSRRLHSPLEIMIEPGSDFEDRRLAATGGTDQRSERPGIEMELETAHDLQ